MVNKIIPDLKRDVHYIMEEKSKTASLTEAGNTKAEELLGVENIYDPQHIELLHHIYQDSRLTIFISAMLIIWSKTVRLSLSTSSLDA